MQKQRRVAHRRREILKYGTFQIQCRRMHFLYESPTPLEKLGDLTWKGFPLISKFSKPPSSFETPKVQPPFSSYEYPAYIMI